MSVLFVMNDNLGCYHLASWKVFFVIGVSLASRAASSECKNTERGHEYRGTLSKTKSGYTCQAWSSQIPHVHLKTPQNYPSAGLVNNYCRNPDNELYPWCYTTSTGKRWEYCDVKICGECKTTERGHEYRGALSKTKSGYTCQAWSSQTPHKHSRTPQNYLSAGLVNNYCRNPDNSLYPWCYTTSTGKRWEYCDVKICSECKTTERGHEYRGALSKTKSGYTCQAWSSQTPHKHSRTPQNYLSAGLVNNYCRNPDNSLYPWCYTTSTGKRWEYCDVKICSECKIYDSGHEYIGTLSKTKSGYTCQAWSSQTPHNHSMTPQNYPSAGLVNNYCRNPDNELYPWCYTTSTSKRWEYCDVMICECKTTEGGHEYRGTLFQTRSGYTCQAWSSQTPHKHSRTPQNYPSAGLLNNYCRNPDNSLYPWCYTTSTGKRWEYCDVKTCGECKIAEHGYKYRGTLSKTKSGYTCQAWSSQTPHKHSRTPQAYPSAGLVNNYCRNPDSSLVPWCYTTSTSKRWEYCDVKLCDQYDVMVNASGTLSSPGFPQNYPDEANQRFYIKAAKGLKVELIFKYFQLERDYDFVTIYNQNHSFPSIKLTGVIDVPYLLLSSGNKLWFVFSTDSSGRKKGYKVLYRQVDKDERKAVVYTDGGNSNGASCVLPFLYNKKLHEQCTIEPRDDSRKRKQWCLTATNADDNNSDKASWGYCLLKGEKGTIQLSGYFDFFDENNDHELNTQAVIMAKAMEFTVSNLNLTFKYKVNFNNNRVSRSLVNDMFNYSIFGIGPMYPRDTNLISEADGTFVSYYSFYDQALDHQSSVYRVTPEDSFRVQALLDIVRTLEWKYVSVISSYGANGDTAAQRFVDSIEKAHSCVYQHLKLPRKKSAEKIKGISNIINSSAIISFTMGEDTENVIRFMGRNKKKKHQIIFAFGSLHYHKIGMKTAANCNGALFLDFPSVEIPKFYEYLCNSNCSNVKVNQSLPVWCKDKYSGLSLCDRIPILSKQNCRKSNCNEVKNNQSFPLPCKDKCSNVSLCNDQFSNISDQFSHFFAPVGQVIKAVKVLVEAIEDSGKYNPKSLGVKARQKLVRDYLRKNSRCNYILPANYKQENDIIKYDIINFVSYGSKYKLIKVGSWSQNRTECNTTSRGSLYLDSITDIIWMPDDRGKSDEALPGMNCHHNEAQKRRAGLKTGACWNCEKCDKNAVVKRNNCISCNRDAKPDKHYKSCILLPRKTLDVRVQWQAQLILALTLTGIVFVFFTVFMFIKHRETKVVKASGREACTFILLGVLLTFVNPFIFIYPPGKIDCSLRQLMPGFAFCLCYAPLFLKVNRIYRIFVNAEKLKKTHMATTRSQVVLAFGIAAFQLVPGCAWIMKSIPHSEMTYPNHRNYVLLHCDVDHSGFFLNLFLGVLFMLGSTWYAFKTRNFPRNFNESKYIGISLYVICMCWALFIPSIFVVKSSNEFVREYMICSLCIMVGFTLLAGLFMPKVKRLLNSSTENQNNASIENPSSTFNHTLSVSVGRNTPLHGSSC